MTKDRIGLVGIGAMGMPIAMNLLNNEYDVSVYGRNPERLKAIEGAGAKIANSPLELADGVDLFITCLPDDRAVNEVLNGDRGAKATLRPGAIFVDMGTSSADLAREVHEILRLKDVQALDAPTSGGDIAAKDGTLTIMVGGPECAFARCLSVFEVIGKRITYFGPAGSGQIAKACNQTIVAATMVGVAEALILAGKNGIELERLVGAMVEGAANCWTLRARIPRLLAGDRSPGMRSQLFLKDLEIVLQTARSTNIPMPLTSTVRELYSSMVAQGLGNYDNSAIVEVLAKLGGDAEWEGKPQSRTTVS